jgi:hypothetical protein
VKYDFFDFSLEYEDSTVIGGGLLRSWLRLSGRTGGRGWPRLLVLGLHRGFLR